MSVHDHEFDFDEEAGTFEGRPFPSESKWLGLEPPDDLVGEDFVAQTVAAICAPSPEQLQTFGPPEPSADFVERTIAALQSDRRKRWRRVLARYIAPDPSPEFVARTLRALAAERGQERTRPTRHRFASLRRWSLPLLAAAAAIVALFLAPKAEDAPIELRAASAVSTEFGPAFGLAHASSPLPAMLAIVDRGADRHALPDAGGDGLWLVLGGDDR